MIRALILVLSILVLSACAGQEAEPVCGEDCGSPEETVSRAVETGGLCGGVAGLACGGGDFCKMAEGQCSMPDASGTCTARPEICTMEYAPVCGCDGQTYSNACGAWAAGVSVERKGACDAVE